VVGGGARAQATGQPTASWSGRDGGARQVVPKAEAGARPVKGRVVTRVGLNGTGMYCSHGRVQFINQKLFQLFTLPQVCKIQIHTLLCPTRYQNFQGGSLNYKEQLSFLQEVQIPNRI
jgi:hypothetical protein